MNAETHCQDVMQVCRNGHVITDMLNSCPERGVSHCDRCGEATIDRCQTCGQELLGAVHVPGLVPIGRLEAPQYCSACGAAFPWMARPVPAGAGVAVAELEKLLRRLPRVIRQLRVRQEDRPPFRVRDERDLEDLLRSLLPLHFDDVRPECRTASYNPGTSTDFLLEPESIALTVKRVWTRGEEEQRIADQLQEDASYYELQQESKTLVCFVYDPEGRLHDPRQWETTWSKPVGELNVRSVIGT